MSKVLAAFSLTFALAAGMAPNSRPAPDTQNPQKPDTAHRQARIQFQYEETRQRRWETTSLGQLFHYGHELEIRSLRGMLVLEVPDEDLLHPLEIPGTPVSAPTQSHRITTWSYAGPNKLIPQVTERPNLEVGDRARIVECIGEAEYHREYESHDKGLAPHSKSEWRWYKTTRNARGYKNLTQNGADTNWSLAFNSQDGLDYFRFSVLPVSGTETEVTDSGGTTNDLSEIVELVIPPLKAPVEKGWVFNRQMDPRGVGASGTLEKTLTDGSTVSGSLRVTIDLDPAQYECLIAPPDNYRNWVPEGGKDEEQVGSTLQFKGEIRCIKGNPAPDRQIWVEVRVDSSTQPGVCLNFPAKGKKTADLLIQREGTSATLELKSNDGTGQDDAWSTATGNLKIGQKFTVKMGSRDFGAFGYIHFNSDAHVRIEGYKDLSSLHLPFDENHNNIADEWEQGSSGAADAYADDDKSPDGDGVDGDGLSVYEEYRGFMCRGVHTRTTPFRKELFIHDPHALGYGLFGQSGITIHFVSAGEFCEEDGAENKHVINCNRAYATLGQQHLLFLRNRAFDDGTLGEAEGPEIGPPKETSFVSVDLVKCRKVGPNCQAGVVAHELGHGCNLWHHGDHDYQARDVKYYGTDDAWHDLPHGAGASGFIVGAVGAQCSGVETCIMRYPRANYYEVTPGTRAWRKTPGGAYILGAVFPAGPFSRALYCDDKKGTGINADGAVAGNASRGNCLHQFQVNDHKPPKVP